jgi:hypothetical protein
MAFHMEWLLLSSCHPPSTFFLSSFIFFCALCETFAPSAFKKSPLPSPSSRWPKQILPHRFAHHFAILKNHLPTQVGSVHARRHLQAFKGRVALR